MSEPLAEKELRQRWARALGPNVEWAQVDPTVAQQPIKAGATLSQLATLGGTLSGRRTIGVGGAADQKPTGTGFEIIGEVERGGMGVVYRARQLAGEATVAPDIDSEALAFTRDAAWIYGIDVDHQLRVWSGRDLSAKPPIPLPIGDGRLSYIAELEPAPLVDALSGWKP